MINIRCKTKMRLLLTLCIFFFIVSCGLQSTPNDKVQVEKLVQSTTSWDGSKLPPYENGEPEITILKITIPPKTTLPLHTHPVINAGVLLKGNLTVITKNNDILHLKAGDALVELVDRLHYGKNESEHPAVIIVFYAGVVGKPITVKQGHKH